MRSSIEKWIDKKFALLFALIVGLTACGGGGGGSSGTSSKTSEAVASSAATSKTVSSAAMSSKAASVAPSSIAKSSVSSLLAKKWGSAEFLEKMPNSYYGLRNPSLASGTNGQVALAWLENGIWAKIYTPQSGWGQAVKLNAADDIDTISRGPLVAADGMGNLFAVWTAGGVHKTWVARYTPESGWSAARSFEGNMSGSIALSVNKQGVAVVAWLDWVTVERSIMAVRYTPESGWGSPVKIAAPKNNTVEVNVQMNAAGDAVLAWYDLSETIPNELSLSYASYSPASGWAEAKQLTKTTFIIDGTNFLPELVADSSNNIWLFWLLTGDVWSAKFQPGSGLGASAKVVDTSKIILRTSVAIDTADRIQLAWNEYHHANLESVSTRQYTKSGGWGAIKVLLESGVNRTPDVVLTPAGDAQVFWGVQEGGVHQFDSIYLSADGSKQSAVQQIIYSNWGDLDMLQTTADSAGNTWATGVANEGGEKKIWINKYQ